jgi:hypothetical protein
MLGLGIIQKNVFFYNAKGFVERLIEVDSGIS